MKPVIFTFAILLAGHSAFAADTVPTRKVASASESDVMAKAKDLTMNCNDNANPKVERIEIKHRFSWETQKDAESTAVFFIATCMNGKNTVSMLFSDEPKLGLQPVPLATPVWNEKTRLSLITPNSSCRS